MACPVAKRSSSSTSVRSGGSAPMRCVPASECWHARTAAAVVQAADTGAIGVGDPDVRGAADAVGLITDAAESLVRNPNEALLLQSLFVRLAALAS